MQKVIQSGMAVILGLYSIQVWSVKPIHDDDFGPGRHGDPPRKDVHDSKKHFERMVKDLKLTAEQQDKARALHETRESLMKTQREKMQPLHEELRQLLEADKVDLTAVRRQLEAIGKGQVEMRMQDIQGRLEFEALLTAEQKKKLRAMHKKKTDLRREKLRRETHGEK